MRLLSNPEFVRNLRAQLRPGRLLAAAAICAALSLAVGYSLAHGRWGKAPPHWWGIVFLRTVLNGQIFALAIGGGIACLHAIHREKDLNTFDFQRVTRLTPLELTLGKLFGAPALAYFVVLALLPAALVGAVVGGVRPSFLVAAYVVILLGSITLHALALLISLLVERGAATAGILLLLAVIGLSASGFDWYGGFHIGQLGPFFAVELAVRGTWDLGPHVSIFRRGDIQVDSGMVDLFFGWPVHHFLVSVVLYLTFTAWFLLAVTRNIKRDPAVYQLYTPAQALGLAFYVNLLLLGFLRLRAFTPLDAQAGLSGLNIGVFLFLGLALLRNREQLRRRMRQIGARAAGWLAATWPAPYLLGGTLAVGFGIVGTMHYLMQPETAVDVRLALFRAVFFALWLTRDILYLQWMKLRPGRRALLLGVLYLLVFYVCANVLFGALGWFKLPRRIPVTAIFVPSPVFVLESSLWQAQRGLWVMASICQAAAAGLFVFLQRRKLREFYAPVARVAEAAD